MNWGVFFVGDLTVRAQILGVCIRAPGFGKLLHGVYTGHVRVTNIIRPDPVSFEIRSRRCCCSPARPAKRDSQAQVSLSPENKLYQEFESGFSDERHSFLKCLCVFVFSKGPRYSLNFPRM